MYDAIYTMYTVTINICHGVSRCLSSVKYDAAVLSTCKRRNTRVIFIENEARQSNSIVF